MRASCWQQVILGLALLGPVATLRAQPADTLATSASASARHPSPAASPTPTHAASSQPLSGVSRTALHVPPPAGGPLTDDAAAPLRYVVERIVIEGNDRTDAGVILARVMVHPGELLDDDKVELTRLRLLASGFFTHVDLSLRRGQRRGQVVLVVRVVERLPLPVVDGIILGFSETTPIFGGLSVIDPNFWGRGVELGGGFVLSPDQQSYRLRVAGGELFGSPIGARMSLLLSRGREPVGLGSDPRAGGFVDYTRGGGYLGLYLQAGNMQRFAIDYHGELIDARPRLSPRVKRIPLIQPGLSYLSTLQLAYQRDTRDRVFVPTRGARLFVGAELSSALIGSAYEYSRYHLAYQQLIPTWAEHSFSLRLDLGVIQAGLPQGNRAGAPFFEAYYIGDYSFFRRNRNSLPRQMGLNLSAFSTYDDLLGSLTASYALPLHTGGDIFYRSYIYVAVNVAEGTSLRELQGEVSGDDRFPVTFDAGLKFDTVAGSFVLSASYLVDLLL